MDLCRERCFRKRNYLLTLILKINTYTRQKLEADHRQNISAADNLFSVHQSRNEQNKSDRANKIARTRSISPNSKTSSYRIHIKRRENYKTTIEKYVRTNRRRMFEGKISRESNLGYL